MASFRTCFKLSRSVVDPFVRFTGVTYHRPQIALDIDARLAQIKVNKDRRESDQHEDQSGARALVCVDSDS